jgi:hypothetical protein
VNESPSSLLKVARFDDWIRKVLHYDSQPPANRIRETLDSIDAQPPPKRRKDEEHDVRPTKRSCLVIPDNTLDAVHPAKIRRLKM